MKLSLFHVRVSMRPTVTLQSVFGLTVIFLVLSYVRAWPTDPLENETRPAVMLQMLFGTCDFSNFCSFLFIPLLFLASVCTRDH